MLNRKIAAAIAAATIGAAGAVAYAQGGNNVNSPDTAARGTSQQPMNSTTTPSTTTPSSTDTMSTPSARADRN